MLKVNKHNQGLKSLDHSNGELQRGSITLFTVTNIEDLARSWQALEKRTDCTVFQSYDWCKTWSDLFAKSESREIICVTGTFSDGELAFVLPFQKSVRLGSQTLEWLGQGTATYSGGTYSRRFIDQNGASWFDLYFADCLEMLAPYDVLNLQNMPNTGFDKQNPLPTHNGSKAANPTFILALSPNFDAILKSKRTAKSLSKIRRRDERLESLGDLQFVQPGSVEAKIQAINECLDIKNEQLRSAGVHHLFTENERKFYFAIAASKPQSLDVFLLQLDGETLSAGLGLMYEKQYTLLTLAMKNHASSNLSPGDYALRRSLEAACKMKLESYDLASGEQDYKLIWADQKVELHNLIKTRNLWGMPLAAYLRFGQSLKRTIKNNSSIRDFFYSLRRFISGKK
jgi:CelD/BcsL family acetyltransferase involved in cellulose biosynthesis